MGQRMTVGRSTADMSDTCSCQENDDDNNNGRRGAVEVAAVDDSKMIALSAHRRTRVCRQSKENRAVEILLHFALALTSFPISLMSLLMSHAFRRVDSYDCCFPPPSWRFQARTHTPLVKWQASLLIFPMHQQGGE